MELKQRDADVVYTMAQMEPKPVYQPSKSWLTSVSVKRRRAVNMSLSETRKSVNRTKNVQRMGAAAR